jgi:uncharacterized membrane protein YjjB (DUF3815 family)
MANVELVILSFLASFGFGIVFQIHKDDLILAGIGGAITRIFYIIFMCFIPYRIVYAALSAFVAAFYAEALATKRKVPSTLFLYPAIIPLIPGDLLYYTMGGAILGDKEMLKNYGENCLLALLGISIGFVVCSSVSHYIRKKNLHKLFNFI